MLVSMLLAPHREIWDLLYGVDERNYDYWYYYWFPAFWLEDGNPVLFMPFLYQTAFLAILAAVLVNLRKSWRRKPKPPPAS